ncbi:MAG: hypothetical protein ABUK11_09155 [Mariprofundaceae bacterium]
MDSPLIIIFYVVYAIAGLMLLWVVIKGLMKGDSIKKIGRDLVKPVSMIIGTLVLWYVYLSLTGMLKEIYQF